MRSTFKKHKYSAQKTIVNGIAFGSKLEAAVYNILLIREKAGEIKNIKMQDAIILKEKCQECGDGPVSWKVDFSFIDSKSGEKIYCEAKGIETSDYKRRKRHWKKHPPAKLEIWKGAYNRPMLHEVIK